MFSQNFFNVLVQIANKMGLQKRKCVRTVRYPGNDSWEYLAEIIYNLNFAIFICNEIYGKNRRPVREPGGSNKISSNTGVPGNYGRVGHPNGT
jgi:hypothetical protein